MYSLKKLLIFIFVTYVINHNLSAQGCNGLNANAGPDQFTCDPSMPPQLMGSTNATEFMWTPMTNLSDPSVLDPIVTAPPGIYKYTLTAKGISTVSLITNGDFEGGFSGFSTAYSRGFPGGGFGPGNIDVGTFPPAYNGGFSPCGDHTSGSGNQLIVDASTAAGTNVWCQTVPTVVGRMYQFTMFSQSVYPANPGQLNVKINNASVGTTSAGGLCSWTEF